MEYIEIDGQEYALGCHERTAKVGEVMPCLEEAIPLLPEAEWKPVDYSHKLPSIVTQGSHSSCVGHQCVDALMGQRSVHGLSYVSLSPWDLYRRICHGRDQGASISEALKVLKSEGVATMEICPVFTLSVGRSAEWQKSAELHKAEEAFDCPTRQAIATAIQCYFYVPLGVLVYSNFTQLQEIDDELCVPKPAGRLRGGHCVVGCGMKRIGGKWYVKIATKSWTDAFGDKGCIWYCLDWFDDKFADAWALRTVTFSNQ